MYTCICIYAHAYTCTCTFLHTHTYMYSSKCMHILCIIYMFLTSWYVTWINPPIFQLGCWLQVWARCPSCAWQALASVSMWPLSHWIVKHCAMSISNISIGASSDWYSFVPASIVIHIHFVSVSSIWRRWLVIEWELVDFMVTHGDSTNKNGDINTGLMYPLVS